MCDKTAYMLFVAVNTPTELSHFAVCNSEKVTNSLQIVAEKDQGAKTLKESKADNDVMVSVVLITCY